MPRARKLDAMRKAVLVLLILLCLVVAAGPTLAQERDPFEPQGGSGVVEPENGETEPGTAEPGEEEPEVEPEPSDGGLGNTGLDLQPWLVLAYVLVALGTGAVVVGRVLHEASDLAHRSEL